MQTPTRFIVCNNCKESTSSYYSHPKGKKYIHVCETCIHKLEDIGACGPGPKVPCKLCVEPNINWHPQHAQFVGPILDCGKH